MIGNQKIVFIINPASGLRSRKPGEEVIRNFYKNKPVEIEIVKSKERGHASELAKKAISQNATAVVAIGGDGTVNEIAKVLNGTNVALGIIPCGSGNGLARHHLIPFKIQDSLQVILNHNIVNHDSVKINDYISFNVSGIGFDAHVAHLFGKDGKRGFISYAKLVLKEFASYNEFEFSLNYNGKQIKYKAMLVAIANGTQFGNNARIAPVADTNDGKAVVTVVKKMNFLQLPGFALKVFNGRIDHSSFATLMNEEKFTITCNHELPLHVDGEPSGFSTSFEITTLKSTLRLIVP